MSSQETVFVRPTRQMLLLFWKWVIIVVSLFLLAYLGANQLATENPDRHAMYMDWELGVPLVPWMIVIYLSYVGVFLLLPMVMKKEQALVSLAYSFLASTLVATVIFVLFPGELGYHRPEYVAGFDFFFQGLYEIDRPHNLYPSIHVTFSALTAWAMVHQTNVRWFHVAILGWAVLLAASVILVHQHHLFDILTGLLLAGGCYRWVYLRFL